MVTGNRGKESARWNYVLFLADFQSQQPAPDTGTLRGDLLAESQRDPELGVARPLTDSFARRLGDVIVAGIQQS